MNNPVDIQILSMMKDPSFRDEAFLKLMNSYKEPIYSHIRRLVVSHEDAEDILQETFINVYRFAESFKGESNVFTWLYRIATNECIKHFRKNKKWINKAVTITERMDNELSGFDTENSDTILFKISASNSSTSRKTKNCI